MFKENFPVRYPETGSDGADFEKLEASISPEASLEEIKDKLFDSYMLEQVTESFFDDLEEYVPDFKIVEDMRDVLSEYEDKDVYAALSWPHELRERRFTKFCEDIKNGVDPKDVMRNHIEYCISQGYGVGYHTSPFAIRPDGDGHWLVKPTEADHRDGDLSRAYYSDKYRHLFKKKNPEYVYVVRTEPETHKTDGNWSRASSLSIVTALPYKNVVDHVETTAREFYEKKNGRHQS